MYNVIDFVFNDRSSGQFVLFVVLVYLLMRGVFALAVSMLQRAISFPCECDIFEKRLRLWRHSRVEDQGPARHLNSTSMSQIRCSSH